MGDRRPCKSDLSDEGRVLIESVITVWKAQHRPISGHPGTHDMREIVTIHDRKLRSAG